MLAVQVEEEDKEGRWALAGPGKMAAAAVKKGKRKPFFCEHFCGACEKIFSGRYKGRLERNLVRSEKPLSNKFQTANFYWI
jgi:hypothetical protein